MVKTKSKEEIKKDLTEIEREIEDLKWLEKHVTTFSITIPEKIQKLQEEKESLKKELNE